MFLRLIVYYLFKKKREAGMKTFIVIMATVILGVLIWGLILGPGENSLYSQASRLLDYGIEQLQTIP